MAMHRATKSEVEAAPRRGRRKGPGRHAAGVPLAALEELPAAPVQVAITDETLTMPVPLPSPFAQIIAEEAAASSTATSHERNAPVDESSDLIVEVPTIQEQPAAILEIETPEAPTGEITVDQAIIDEPTVNPVPEETTAPEQEILDGEYVVEDAAFVPVDAAGVDASEDAVIVTDEPVILDEPAIAESPRAEPADEPSDFDDDVIEPVIDDPSDGTNGSDMVVAEMVMGEVAPATPADPAKEVHIHHHYHEAAEQQAPQVIIAGPPIYMNEWPTDVPVAPIPRQQYTPQPADDADEDEEASYRSEAYAPILREERPTKKTKKAPASRAPLPEKEPLFTWRGRPIGKKYQDAAPYIPAPREIEAAPADRPEPKRRAERRQVISAGIDPTDWFQNTVLNAIERGASDLHVRVEENSAGTTDVLTARVRIDGRMRHLETIEGEEARVILNRFKAQAELSTNGSFVPEETVYEVEVDGEIRKARVALFRTAAAGDALVLRLPSAGPLLRLEDLNFAPTNEQLVNNLLHASNRMLMIAGPMGSGKTTTAHAALQKVTTTERSVWSLEDPVERDLPGVTQLEVDEENGAGFDALLPVLVRSDYDTLFLGEIRDNATASAGVRQAKAGRQVITTIHANDNVTALYRLIELAKDSPLSVLDSVVGVISQRLVGRLNPDWDGVNPDEKYKGRVPIHEVLTITPELTEAIMRDTPITEVQKIAESASSSTFLTDGFRLVQAGITDRDEVFRVIGRAE